jgi:hypothetical protein
LPAPRDRVGGQHGPHDLTDHQVRFDEHAGHGWDAPGAGRGGGSGSSPPAAGAGLSTVASTISDRVRPISPPIRVTVAEYVFSGCGLRSAHLG